MLEDKLIWPPKMTKASGPRDVLVWQVDKLRTMQPDLTPDVTKERPGENRPDGTSTYRIDLTVNLNGRQIEVATVEYPQDAPGYPALVITGDAPYWRYNHAYDPDELVDVLKHEFSRDIRLAA